ncbi:MAG: GtrA family protein [Chloroflexota bacterium]|nr:GtrA family protein [Chloroflexota bacterium]
MVAKTRTLLQDNRKEVTRFLKFCVVGVIGTVIDFGTLNLLIQLFAFPKILANTCSFSLALVNNFIWNRLWVYPETRGEPFLGQLLQFTLVNVVGWALNTGIFYSADLWVLGEAGLLAGPMSALAVAIGMKHFDLAYNLAKAFATGVVLFWNFFINRVWTFRHVK